MRNRLQLSAMLILTALGSACRGECTSETAVEVGLELAGPSPVICENLFCITEAWENGEAAWLDGGSQTGIDSVITSWIVVDEGGRLWFGTHDSFDSTGTARLCVAPLLRSDGNFQCERFEPSEPYQFCGPRNDAYLRWGSRPK